MAGIANAINQKTIYEVDQSGNDEFWQGEYGIFTNNTGSTINFGEICAINNGGDAALADADFAPLAVLICVESGGVSNGSDGKFLFKGIVVNTSWSFTAGKPLYRSTTAGAMTDTAPSTSGDYIQTVAQSVHATGDVIHWNPSLDQAQVA